MSAQTHAADAGHANPTGFVRRWLYSTNHKDIGTMYIIFSILAALIGGGFSIFMRMELMEPGVQYMADGHVWNVFTTAHGLIMVFFVVMPGLIGGFGNWFVPIMIGAPDMAFPRMNNISFWLLPPAFILLLLSAVMDGGAGVGWTIYPPMSSTQPVRLACLWIWPFCLCIWQVFLLSWVRPTLSPRFLICAHQA